MISTQKILDFFELKRLLIFLLKLFEGEIVFIELISAFSHDILVHLFMHVVNVDLKFLLSFFYKIRFLIFIERLEPNALLLLIFVEFLPVYVLDPVNEEVLVNIFS